MTGRCRDDSWSQRWVRVEARNGAPAGLDLVVRLVVWNHFWVMASFENLMDTKERILSIHAHTHMTFGVRGF